MKKFISLILSVFMALSMAGCVNIYVDSPQRPENEITENVTPPADRTRAPIDKDGSYYSKEDVALYIHTYGHLPDNFITKDEARALGWDGGNVEEYAPGCAIGGDEFGNREGLLPEGHTWYECDIDTHGYHSRGSRRIVFSDDGLIYYTHDHYDSFELLYGEDHHEHHNN